MTRYITKSDNYYYICNSVECKKANGNKSVSIAAVNVEKAVLKSIRTYSKTVIDKMNLKQQNKNKKEAISIHQFFEKQIQQIKNKLYDCDSRNIELYEKYKKNRITVEEFHKKKEECIAARNKLQIKINELIKYQEEYRDASDLDDNERKLLETYSKKRTLTQEMVDLVVDKVIIYDKDNVDVRFLVKDFKDIPFLSKEGV